MISVKNRLKLVLLSLLICNHFLFQIGFANGQPLEPLLKIDSPSEGTIFAPGDSLSVEVSVAPGVDFSRGLFVFGEVGSSQPLFIPPFVFSDLLVPETMSIGSIEIFAIGFLDDGSLVASDPIGLLVERIDSPISLMAQPSRLEFDVVGQQQHLLVTGKFSDNKEITLNKSQKTTYLSEDPSVAMVNSSGLVTGVGPGSTSVVVNHGNFSKTISVSVSGSVEGDQDGDGIVDIDDLNKINDLLALPATSPFDPADLNRDGIINHQDEEILKTLCTSPDCLSGNVVVVPFVLGTERSEAESRIVNSGLMLGGLSFLTNGTVPSGLIFDQNPDAGTTVTQGTQIALVISSGPPKVSVPNVVGLEQLEAENTLTTSGLAVGNISSSTSPNVPVGFVISQEPSPGDEIPEGSPVNLEISSGPEFTEVPNVVEFLQADAEAAIGDVGLTVGNITFEPHPTIPKDHVISQDPEAGQEANEGDPVDLVVSTGPPPFRDLTISNLDKNGLQYNGQELTVSESISATVSNPGNTDVTTPFTVLFFEDVNNDGVFDSGSDRVLGQSEVTTELPAGESTFISTPLSGPVSFSGNLIWGFVDSGDVIVEDDENNNLANCGESCVEPQVLQAGVQDDFSLPADPVSPSPALEALFAVAGGTQEFDLIAGMNGGLSSKQVAHTFTDLPNDITGAKLELRVHAGDDPQVFTDGIIFSFVDESTVNYADAIVFGRSFGPTEGTGTIFMEPDPGLLKATNWATGDVRTFSLDLAALPLLDGSTLNLIPQLIEKGFLDVNVSDETGVDFMRLSLISQVQSSTPAPDLTASLVQVSKDNGTVNLSARIGNGGAMSVDAGVPVSFYDGNPQGGWSLVGYGQHYNGPSTRDL